MPLPTNRAYPTKATNRAWQKKKTLADKASKKANTGLGKRLEAAAEEWGLIRWDELDITKYAAPNSETLAKAHLKKARGAILQVSIVRQQLARARDAADDASKNKALSKQARAYARVVWDELDKAYKRLQPIDQVLGDFQAVVDRLSQAKRELEDIAIFSGNLLVGKADRAEQDDNVLIVPRGAWLIPANAQVGLAGQKFRVTASANDNSLFSAEMTLKKIVGQRLTFEV